MTKKKVQWQDPPLNKRTGHERKYEELVEELKKNPGRWALFGRANAQVAPNIRTGRLAAFRPSGAFEVTTRSTAKEAGKGTRADIYVRYIGED